MREENRLPKRFAAKNKQPTLSNENRPSLPPGLGQHFHQLGGRRADDVDSNPDRFGSVSI
jgi:hypothetical protein